MSLMTLFHSNRISNVGRIKLMKSIKWWCDDNWFLPTRLAADDARSHSNIFNIDNAFIKHWQFSWELIQKMPNKMLNWRICHRRQCSVNWCMFDKSRRLQELKSCLLLFFFIESLNGSLVITMADHMFDESETTEMQAKRGQTCDVMWTMNRRCWTTDKTQWKITDSVFFLTRSLIAWLTVSTLTN